MPAGLKEHDLGLKTTHGVIMKGQKVVEAEAEKPAEPARCPLLHILCTEDCALYDGGRCAIATGAAAKPGGKCPFSGVNSGRRCIPNCPVKAGENCGLCPERKGN